MNYTEKRNVVYLNIPPRPKGSRLIHKESLDAKTLVLLKINFAASFKCFTVPLKSMPQVDKNIPSTERRTIQEHTGFKNTLSI